MSKAIASRVLIATVSTVCALSATEAAAQSPTLRPSAPNAASPAPLAAPATDAAPEGPAAAAVPPPPSTPATRRSPPPPPQIAQKPLTAATIAETPGSPFQVDFVTDGAMLTLAIGFAALSDMIIGTGEITPQQPQDASRLLSIDRRAVSQSYDQQASVISNVGLWATIAFAALDPVSTGVRLGAREGIVDAMIYAETIAITGAVTNLAKIAFRRPRPEAYAEQQKLYEEFGKENAPDISSTDSALSFFSGHTAVTAAITATATYLAAKRVDTKRMMLVAALGTMTTVLVGYGRVRAGKHFPTDVLAGAMAGAGIGVLVPHLHRASQDEHHHDGPSEKRHKGTPQDEHARRIVPRAYLVPTVIADQRVRGGALGLGGTF